jgi:GNAT superfamily N-acetyltransferase
MPFVRPANPNDLADLQSFDHFNEITAETLQTRNCIVVGIDDRLLGYAILSRHFFGRPFVELLLVHPDHRRHGLANALLHAAESQSPAEALWISTALGNFPMQSLLNRRGYKHSGVIHDLTKVPELIYHKPPAK